VKDRRYPRNMFPPLTRRSAAARCRVHSRDNFAVGTWLSLVEHSLGVRGVGSSNLPVPTIKSNLYRLPPHSPDKDSLMVSAISSIEVF
jgi:hypothetical protein